MKEKKVLLNGISILIGAVIAVLALVRGTWQPWILSAILLLWGIWAAVVLLLPRVQVFRRRLRRKRARQRLLNNSISQVKAFEIPTITPNPVEQVLLRHVNHRISSYLKSTCGEATWEWCEKAPAQLAIQGGVGRIRIYGMDDASYADVHLDQNGGICLDLIQVTKVPEGRLENTADKMSPNRQPVDPQIWYETQGRKILESMVADLSSRGHSRLTLHENGDVSITQEQEEVVQEHLGNFPAMIYWPRLIQVLESEGLAAEVANQKIIVSW